MEFSNSVTTGFPSSSMAGTSFGASGTKFSGFTGTVILPIAEWAGSGTVNLGSNDVEYVSNSSTSDAADTTSFVYGPAGSATPGTLTTPRLKRVRFQTPIQATDQLSLEIKNSTGAWTKIENIGYQTGLKPLHVEGNATTYGMGLSEAAVNSTDVDVVFGRYFFNSGATFNSAGSNWGSLTNTVWRVVKSKAGAAVGFGLASATQSGLVTREQFSSNVSMALSSSFSGTLVAKFSRIGKMVTMTADPLASITATSTGVLEFTVPADYAPTSAISFICHAYINAVYVATYGTIGAGGTASVYKSAAAADFVNTDTFRWVQGITLSWVLD